MEKIFNDIRLLCLFIIDDTDSISEIELHLDERFQDYGIAQTIEEAEQYCISEQPHIIFFGTKVLQTSEGIYLNLIKKVNDFERHRAVLMVKAMDADRAYNLCKNKVFSDYLVVKPLYDKNIFNMAIARSIEVLKEHDGLEVLYDIERKLRKLQLSNEKNNKIEKSIQHKVQAIQQQLTSSLSDEINQLPENISSCINNKIASDEFDYQLLNLTASFRNTLTQANNDMTQMLGDLGDKTQNSYEDMNAGLSSTINSMGIKRTILIIEDDSFFIQMLTNLLETAGYIVHATKDGKTGLEMIGRVNPDIIILDWNLPDIMGFDVLKQIKSNIKYSHLPVIVLTGHSNPKVVKEAITLGASYFIVKPSKGELILNKVESALFSMDAPGSNA